MSIPEASMTATHPTHIEDFTPGPWFITDALTVGEDEIIDFASQFDPQPFHLGHDSAQGTFFGALAASGWHTAGLTMRLLVTSGYTPGWGFIGRAIESLEWPRPTRPGDRLHLEAEILEAKASRSKPELGIVRTRMVTRNQNGDAAQVMICAMVVPTRAGQSAAA
jgi:acyl dehydratase